MKKKKVFIGMFDIMPRYRLDFTRWRAIAVMALLFAFVCTTCSLSHDEPPPPRGVAIDASVPIITQQPPVSAVLLTTGGTNNPLTVKADSQDEGVISYEWLAYTDPADYENDTGTPAAGTGANTASFTPDLTTEGVFYFYVRVTNTLNTTGKQTASVKSNSVIVTVNDPANAYYPLITQQPESGNYAFTNPTEVTLNITASTTDNGALTYQWFEASSAGEVGTAIPGAESATLTQSIATAGDHYYYVEVTNTRPDAPGRQTSKLTSWVTVKIIETNNTFTVDIGTKYQYVRGFGGQSVLWDNAPDDTIADYETMYDPNKLGYNIMRIQIPPDNVDIDEAMRALAANELGYSTGGRIFGSNPTLQKPNYGSVVNADGEMVQVSRDMSDYFDLVKVVNKYNGYVLASPWSPPAAWKTNDSINGQGGTLRTNNYVDWANYLKRFCEIMYEHGAPIYTISMQNEASYPAEWDGCQYSQSEHAAWWRTPGIGRFTTSNGTPVKGYGGGRSLSSVLTMSGEAHNEINYLNSVLQGTTGVEARQYIDILGRHIYGAGITENSFFPLARDHATDPKEVWMSEWNLNSQSEASYPNDSTWNYAWGFMNSIDLTIRLNHENAFIWWTSKRFYSLIGDGTYGTSAGEPLPRGHGLSHYAKFAKEAGRVGVTLSGSNAGSANPNTYTKVSNGGDYANSNLGPKITAYVTLNDNFYAGPVETRNRRWNGLDGGPGALGVNDIKAISLVMYTPTNGSGGGGTDMGTVKIELPEGFVIGNVTAMRSTSAVRSRTEAVTIGADKRSAFITLPASNMFSVRFEKQQ